MITGNKREAVAVRAPVFFVQQIDILSKINYNWTKTGNTWRKEF